MSRLDEIRAREAAATPGPWRWDEYQHVLIAADQPNEWTGECVMNVWGYDFETSWRNKKLDGEFIVNAREDIPFLLAEIERLELALTTATVEVHGQRMYRTRYGTPMEMPAKIERMVRSSLEKR